MRMRNAPSSDMVGRKSRRGQRMLPTHASIEYPTRRRVKAQDSYDDCYPHVSCWPMINFRACMACHGDSVNFHSSNDSMMFTSRSFDDSLLLNDTFTTKLHVASSLTDDFAWKFDDLMSKLETQSTRRTDDESLDEGTIAILHDVSSTDGTDDVNRMEEVEMFYVPIPSEDYQAAMKAKEARREDYQTAMKVKEARRDCKDVDTRSKSILQRETLNKEVEGRTISIPDRRADDLFNDDVRADDLFKDDRREDDLFQYDRREDDHDRREDELFDNERTVNHIFYDGIDIGYAGTNPRRQNKMHQMNSEKAIILNKGMVQSSVRRLHNSPPSQQKRLIQEQYENRLRSSSRPGTTGQMLSLGLNSPATKHGHEKNQMIGRRLREMGKREAPTMRKRTSQNQSNRLAPVSARVTQAMKQNREKKYTSQRRRRDLEEIDITNRQRSQSLDPNHKRTQRAAYHRLYASSSAKQLEGKKRRELLEKSYKQKAARRNGELVKKTGKISIEKATKLYDRCMHSKIRHEAKVAKLIEEKIVEEENRSSTSITKERKSTVKCKKSVNRRIRPNWSSQMYWNQGEERSQYKHVMENQLFPISEE